MDLHFAIFYFLLTFVKKVGFVVGRLGLKVLIHREGERVNSVNKQVKCLILQTIFRKDKHLI